MCMFYQVEMFSFHANCIFGESCGKLQHLLNCCKGVIEIISDKIPHPACSPRWYLIISVCLQQESYWICFTRIPLVCNVFLYYFFFFHPLTPYPAFGLQISSFLCYIQIEAGSILGSCSPYCYSSWIKSVLTALSTVQLFFPLTEDILWLYPKLPLCLGN